MNTVLALIIMIHNNTIKSDINYSFSKYLLENLNRLEQMTLRNISKECYISTSSIINYCKALGFDSFSEFKHQLYDNIKIRKMQIHFRYRKMTEERLLEDIARFAGIGYDCKVLEKSVDDLIDLIFTNNSITIIGASFPVALSYSFQEDLTIMGRPIHIMQPRYGELDHQFEPGSLLMLITITGRFAQISTHFYHLTIAQENDLVIISQDSQIGSSKDLGISLPFIGDTEYNDVILLLIFDLIKLKYYNRHFS